MTPPSPMYKKIYHLFSGKTCVMYNRLYIFVLNKTERTMTAITHTPEFDVCHNDKDIWLEFTGYNLVFSGAMSELESEAEKAARESGSGYISIDDGERQFNPSTKGYISENLRAFALELLASGKGEIVND